MSRFTFSGACAALLLWSACSSEDHTVRTTEPSVNMTTGQTRQLVATATGGVVWSVASGNGAITADGLYTAPAAVGAYHATAASKVEPAKTVTIAIQVRAAVVLHGLPAVPFVTAGRALALSIDDPAPSAIAWTVSGGALASGQGTTAATFTAGAPGPLQVTATVDDGDAGTRAGTAALTIVAPAVAPNIRTQAFVLSATPGATAVADASPPLSVAWSLDGGTLTSAADGGSITYTPGGGASVAITASAINQALDSASSTVVVPAGDAGVQVLAGQPGGLGFVDGPAGVSRLLSPTAVVADSTGVYLADYGTIRRYQEDAGTLTTLVGTVGSPFGLPATCSPPLPSAQVAFGAKGLALSGHGTLYVWSDTGRVCEVDHAGNASFVGQLDGGLDGLAVLGDKIAALQGGLVTELDAGFDVSRVTDAGSLQHGTTAGLTIDLDGGVWVSGREGAGDSQVAVVKLIGAGGATVVSSAPSRWPFPCDAKEALCVPTSLAQLPFDGVLVADYGLGTLSHVKAGSTALVAGVPGAFDVTSGPALGAHLGRPVAVWRDIFGSVFFLEGSSGLLRKLSADGQVTTLAGTLDAAGAVDGPGIAARLSFPTSVAVGPAGEVWVGEFQGRLLRIGPEGVARTVATLPCTPTHLAVGAAAELMVACDDSTIRGVTAAGVVRIAAGSPGAGFADGPAAAAKFGKFDTSSAQVTEGTAGGALAYDGVDTLYIADAKNGRVRALKAGLVSTFAQPTGVPEGVAVSSAGVHVLIGGAHVTRLSAAGAVLADSAIGRTLPLSSIAATAAGAVYLTDAFQQRVLRLDPGGALTTAAGNPDSFALAGGPTPGSFAAPISLAVAPPGAPNEGALFVADFADNAVAMVRR